MATTTTNLGLTKPAGTDEVDIAVINANMDTIDAYVFGRAISYDFGGITAANINEVSAALIAKFNTCANGAHNYVGVWSGNYYFGGTIHKIDAGIGVMTFFPSVPSSTQASIKIYNAGSGWNSTSI